MARQLGLNLDASSLNKSWNPKTEKVDESKESDDLGGFDCNICLDTVEDPVVTLCGHLYCWPCIYRWIHHQSQPSENSENQEPKCPVCKSQISEKTMIPLYGPGSTPKPSDKKVENHGIAIPQRPPTPRTPNLHQIQPMYQRSLSQLDHHHHVGGGMFGEMVYSRMFGEMVYSRMFGDSGTTMMAYQNSYNLGGNARPRITRHIKEVDRSLSRISFFFFCCLVLCLLFF